MYYDFEHDEYITLATLKEWFDNMSEEEKQEYSFNFLYYLNCCMSFNNGCLYTIEKHEEYLKKQLSKLESISQYTIDEYFYYVSQLKRLYEFKENNE